MDRRNPIRRVFFRSLRCPLGQPGDSIESEAAAGIVHQLAVVAHFKSPIQRLHSNTPLRAQEIPDVVRLPRKRQPIKSSAGIIMNGYLETRPLRIFVVEDHVDTLNCLKLYLESLDHTVLTAQTVAEALAELPSANCEVLISDIGLPDGTGWELLEKARLPRPIYAIAMSGGFSFNDASIRSHSVGYRHHLLKPFTPVELKNILVEAAREVTPL
jgi:CheY-like chemotaxis protein